jgi:hypothetical protein
LAFLEKARIPMQVDIGFGDVVNPEAEERDYLTLLDLPAPNLRMYPRETVIAEKFEAMVDLGCCPTLHQTADLDGTSWVQSNGNRAELMPFSGFRAEQ